MNILVTGGLGFIGSNFINYWREKYPQDTIINLDSNTYAAYPGNIKNPTTGNYTWWNGDICSISLLDFIMRDRNIDLIVHFAAETHVDNSINASDQFIKTNVMGTHALLEVARRYGVRFHHVSTDEVFGSLELGSKERFTEESPYNPRNPYSASKAAADHLVRAYHHTYGLATTVSNCSNNYGMNQHEEKLIPRAIKAFLNDEKMGIYGDGKNVRDWVFVMDHVVGIEKVIKHGAIGETYLFGGEELSNMEIMGMLMLIMGKGKLEFIEDRKGHDRRYAVDTTKSMDELGWFPKISLETGLINTVLYYKEKYR